MQLGPGGKNETTVSACSRLDLFKPVVKPFFVVEKHLHPFFWRGLDVTAFLMVGFFKEAWAALTWTVWEYLIRENTSDSFKGFCNHWFETREKM